MGDVAPGELEQGDRRFEAGEQGWPKRVECPREVSRLLAGLAGEEDLAAVGMAANAGGQIDGLAKHVAIRLEDGAVVDGATDLDGAPGGLEALDSLLDGKSVGGGIGNGIEDEEEAIAKAAHDPAAGHGGSLVEHAGHRLQEPVGLDIAELAGKAKRPGHIDKEERAGGGDEVVSAAGTGGCGQEADLRVTVDGRAACLATVRLAAEYRPDSDTIHIRDGLERQTPENPGYP